MTREQIQAKLLTYATLYGWPYMQLYDWSLDDKYSYKQFINLAPDALLLEALQRFYKRNLYDQLIAG